MVAMITYHLVQLVALQSNTSSLLESFSLKDNPLQQPNDSNKALSDETRVIFHVRWHRSEAIASVCMQIFSLFLFPLQLPTPAFAKSSALRLC